jgi:hypothetical protein
LFNELVDLSKIFSLDESLGLLLNEALCFGLARVQLIQHVPESWLWIDLGIKRQGLGLWLPRDKIGETPGDESFAVWLRDAKGKEVAENLALQLSGCRVPVAGVVVLVASNVDLGHLGFNSDGGVSLDVFVDTNGTVVETIVEIVRGHVRLETDTMDWASSILQVLDQVVQTI